MADRSLFKLDAEGRWRLSYDRQQWILQRRAGSPRAGKGSAVRDTGWKAVSFVGSEKHVLRRVIREAGVVLTPEALALLDALPETFLDFVAAPTKDTSTQHLEADEAVHIEAEAA